MTREELKKEYADAANSRMNAGVFADRILAALEKEREGDIVIHHGTINRHGYMIDEYGFRTFVDVRLYGHTGQLIFRPTKAEKGGK